MPQHFKYKTEVMKPVLTMILALLTISCTASSTEDGETITSGNDSGNDNAQATKMKITIGTTVFIATLNDNPSADAFIARLPLTINMTELNNNEKYYDLSTNLPTNASIGGNIKVGDLMLHGNNVLVLFYKSFNTSYSYTKLGYIDNPKGFAATLGAENVAVKFEKN
jgi:hypothetical protein